MHLVQDKAISLDVVSIEEPTEDKEAEKARTANLAVLDGILGQVHSSKRVAHDALEARGAFRFKEVSATAYYAGPFTIGNAMTIKVKVRLYIVSSVEDIDIDAAGLSLGLKIGRLERYG